MRRAARRDHNHAAIVKTLQAVGVAVKDVSGLPGALDLLVGYRGRLYWFEIKDGDKSASRRALTPAERETIAAFERVGAPVFVVTSADEALRVVGAIE